MNINEYRFYITRDKQGSHKQISINKYVDVVDLDMDFHFMCSRKKIL